MAPKPIKLSELWMHGPAVNRLPADWPLYNVREVRVGDAVGPMTYEVDDEVIERYSRVMGVAACLYPTIPARHSGPLRNSHADDADNAHTINARMMVELGTPIKAGDVLTIDGAVVGVYERRGKPYIAVQTRTVNQHGALVDRLRQTMLLSRKSMGGKWTFL